LFIGPSPTFPENFVQIRLEAGIDNRKKIVKQQYLLQMFPQYGELRLTGG